jgi:TM2 domain-containing membrane protein YozV
MTRYCTKCGATNEESAQYCQTCQTPLAPASGGYQAAPGSYQAPGYQSPPVSGGYQSGPGYQPMQAVNPSMTDWKALGGDKKIVAGILGIVLGAFGIHKFILGYTTEGIIMLAITLVSCGILGMVTSIIGIVEGIMYLTKSDEEFVRTYIQNKKGWF